MDQELHKIHHDWVERKDEEESDIKKTQECQVGGEEEAVAVDVPAEAEILIVFVPKDLHIPTIDLHPARYQASIRLLWHGV